MIGGVKESEIDYSTRSGLNYVDDLLNPEEMIWYTNTFLAKYSFTFKAQFSH